MKLSNVDILRYLDSGELVITPLDRETQVKPASVDCRLSGSIVRRGIREDYQEGDIITVEPLEFLLGSTMETVTMSDFLSADVATRSSIGRKGLFTENAGFIDPGFSGQITLELFNASSVPLVLVVGQRICQLKFDVLMTPANPGYRELAGSKYNGQRGATESRLAMDLDMLQSNGALECPKSPTGKHELPDLIVFPICRCCKEDMDKCSVSHTGLHVSINEAGSHLCDYCGSPKEF